METLLHDCDVCYRVLCFLLPATILSSSSKGVSDGWGMWHVWERREMSTGFWWKNLKERNYFEGVIVAGRKLLKLILNKFSDCVCVV